MGPFATATEFCEYTGIGLPSDLARLQSILAMSSSVIRSFCGQELSVVTDEEVTVQPSDTETLVLPERPVTAVSVLEGTVPVTEFTFTRSGLVFRTSGSWSVPTTVIYTHGYTETEPEFIAIKTICMDSASRAFTLNERSASEAMGSTLMESAGYSPEVFLTQGEQMRLADFGKVGVG